MKETWELYYTYPHCNSILIYSAGEVNSEEEARQWVIEREKSMESYSHEKDDRCDCRADYCPVKFGRPVYSYNKVMNDEKN